jgi:glycosyltransferase involved in cell wall biosynthesis
MSALAESHRISLLTFLPSADQARPLDPILGSCDQVITVPNDRIGLTGAARRALQVRAALAARSYDGLALEQRSFQSALDDMAARSSYDIIQIESCFLSRYAFPPDTAVVLDEHNVEYEIRHRTVAIARSPLRKLHSYLDYLALRTEEQHAWRAVDACAVTSPRDQDTVRATFPGARTAVVPNAVDTQFFSPRGVRPDRRTLLFFGALGYYPNVDAALFFVHEVMPLLRRSHPSLRLLIVGASPPPEIRRCAGPDVIVTGEVEDVRPYLERAHAVVAPIRIGGGTRLKILEAMAMAKPVVSTSLGAEGLAAADRRELLLADNADDFALRVSRVLNDDDLAASLGSAARRLVETSYDWSASARNLEALYRSALFARALRTGSRAAQATANIG